MFISHKVFSAKLKVNKIEPKRN